MTHRNPNANAIAIVGMAGRFPKAANLDQYWKNLCDGVDAISSIPQPANAHGADPDDGHTVNVRAFLEGADMFDAGFFDIKPREAEILDPQQRVFLECAWEALEDAGIDPARYDGVIPRASACSAHQ